MQIRTPRLFAVLLLALVLAAGCGGDDDTAAEDASTTTTGDVTDDTDDTEPTDDEPPNACELVPADEVNEAAGLTLGEGADTGDERRSVCAFSATESGGVGVTVGVEAGSRFDEKAARSEDIFGSPGEDIPDIGDEALFWFTTEEFPEGLSGVLIGKGDLTVDISVQGIADEAEARDAAVAIATLAGDGL